MVEVPESRFRPGFFSWVSQVVQEKRAMLINIARREGLSAEDALDVVQDAFITLFEIPQGRQLAEESDDLARFLVVLVRNAARNRRRRHYLKKEHIGDPETLNELEADLVSVDDLVQNAEDHVALQGCLKKLKEVQHNVVRLRMLEDVSGEKVAEMLQISTDNVAVLLFRAKKALKACLLS